MTTLEKNIIALWRKGRTSDEIAKTLTIDVKAVQYILWDLGK